MSNLETKEQSKTLMSIGIFQHTLSEQGLLRVKTTQGFIFLPV